MHFDGITGPDYELSAKGYNGSWETVLRTSGCRSFVGL